MRRLALFGCVFLCGCYGLTESMIDDILDDYVPEEPTLPTASRLAFVSSDNGDVSCVMLDIGGSDPVVTVPGNTTAIAAGEAGDLFIGTEEQVFNLDAAWSATDTLNLPTDVVRVDGVAADAGTVVVATTTDDGAVVLIYDEEGRDVVGASAAAPGVTITSIAVADGTAFAVESTGEIVSYDVTLANPVRTPLDAVPGDPVAVVVGDTGNLFVADAATGSIEEIDIDTGVPVDTLFAGGPGLRPVGMAYDPEVRHYLLLTGDDRILEIDRAGRIVETHESELVENATAITFFDVDG